MGDAENGGDGFTRTSMGGYEDIFVIFDGGNGVFLEAV